MSRVFQRISVLFAAAMMALPIAAWAQQSQDPGAGQSTPQGPAQGRQGGAWGRGGQRHMEMLARKLNLNDEQRQQFRAIGQRTRQQAMGIRSDSSLTEDQKKEKLQTLRKQSHQEMFGVLSPEQKEQLKQMREQWQKEHGKNKAPGDQASAKNKADDDDPFAGMTSDDDDGPIAKAP